MSRKTLKNKRGEPFTTGQYRTLPSTWTITVTERRLFTGRLLCPDHVTHTNPPPHPHTHTYMYIFQVGPHPGHGPLSLRRPLDGPYGWGTKDGDDTGPLNGSLWTRHGTETVHVPDESECLCRECRGDGNPGGARPTTPGHLGTGSVRDLTQPLNLPTTRPRLCECPTTDKLTQVIPRLYAVIVYAPRRGTSGSGVEGLRTVTKEPWWSQGQ